MKFPVEKKPLETLKRLVCNATWLLADTPAQVLPHTDVSYLITSPNIQRASVYERRVAAPLQAAHRRVCVRSIHPETRRLISSFSRSNSIKNRLKRIPDSGNAAGKLRWITERRATCCSCCGVAGFAERVLQARRHHSSHQLLLWKFTSTVHRLI